MKTKIAFTLLFAASLSFNIGCATNKRTALETSRIDRTHNPYASEMMAKQQEKIEQERLAAEKRGENLPPIAAPPLVQTDRAWGQQILPSPF
jgi:hypothetical protein